MMILSHKSLQIPCAIVQNYAFALDLATITCFLLLQVTKFLPKKVQYPDVDLRSTTEPTQFASVYASKVSSLLFFN